MTKNPGKPSLQVGVGIIIHRDDEVLLLRRKFVHGQGTWSTPGGHLEYGETPENCAIREVWEETRLQIESPQFLAITNDIFVEENKHYITIWMAAANPGGEILLSAPEESDRIGWFDWKNLPSPLFLPLQHLLSAKSYSQTSLSDLLTDAR